MDIALVSALTAFVAVIVGPLVTIYVTKRRITAQVVSANRQEWINKLRNDVALFVRDIRLFAGVYRTKVIDDREAVKRFEELMLIQERINLMLNPREMEHQELARQLTSARNKLLEALREKSKNPEGLGAIADSITSHVQGVFKSEWDRVKKGE